MKSICATTCMVGNQTKKKVGQRVKVKRPSQAGTLTETLNRNNALKTMFREFITTETFWESVNPEIPSCNTEGQTCVKQTTGIL